VAGVDYRQSGVDIDAGNDTVRRIKSLARSTYTPGVLSGVGSFGGLFALGGAVPDPVLVASADGVGTKLKVAFMAGVHDNPKLGERVLQRLPMRLVAAFRPEVNAWQGTEGLQLTIEHWWPAP